ncbi:MAG: histidine kinase [Lachnospiraceae bacterium]|nr:histidine kinase [Lachnospiraceae bacterium]
MKSAEPEEAEETTVLFSQYLRTNLDSLRNQEPVPFATELMHIKTYVELEKKRFGDILNVEYDIKGRTSRSPP